ncbi:MAG: ABC transporter substrate-binding protein [Simkaniaceae bacterium]|nr:ABC transporter substrate-binding protein [Simkaniaceae bacterium]
MKDLLKKLLSGVILLVCAACGKKETTKTRLLLDWWPNPNHVCLYVGIEKGIFAKHGLDLEILSLQDPPNAISYLATNQTDLAIYYGPLTLRAKARGHYVSVAGQLFDQPLQGLLGRADSGIEKISDFNGKSIGVFPGDLMDTYKDTMEKKGNFKFSNSRIVQFDVATALYAKTIDIISGVFWNIEPVQLSANGVETKTFKMDEIGLPSYPELLVLAGQTFQEEHPDKVRAFKEALHEANHYCIANPQKAFEIYLAANTDKTAMTIGWERKAWELTHPVLARDQNLNLKELKGFHDWLLESKIISDAIDLDTLQAR